MNGQKERTGGSVKPDNSASDAQARIVKEQRGSQDKFSPSQDSTQAALRKEAEKLARQWGAPFVTRDQRSLDRATGGLLNPRTMANRDSLGKGPAGRLRMGRKIVYPSGSFFEWLVSHLKPASEGCGKAVGES